MFELLVARHTIKEIGRRLEIKEVKVETSIEADFPETGGPQTGEGGSPGSGE